MGRRIVGAFLVLAVFVCLNWDRLAFWQVTTVDTPPNSTYQPAKDVPPKQPPAPIPPGFYEDPLKFLSTAPVDSLVLLPGIGPVIAERVASLRNGKRLFTRWEDLLVVRGIGQKKLERLKQLANGED